MPRISEEQLSQLRQAIHEHPHLRRIVRQVEHLQRVVFHADELNWQFIRASAEEILIADIVSRHQGSFDGIYFSLRRLEDNGKPWTQALNEYATYIHNYYTTPLGVVLRRDLFGENSHFVTPSAGPDSALRSRPVAAAEISPARAHG